MRRLITAISENSRLIPYIYTYAADGGQRFLVELSSEVVRVLDYSGKELARFESNDKLEFYFDSRRCYYKQINNLLIITSTNNQPMVLKRNSLKVWVFEPWKFKHHMWRYNYELRDYPITISREGNEYHVTFAEKENEWETLKKLSHAEHLRASFYVEQQEAEEYSVNLREGVQVVLGDIPDTAKPGERFAVPTENTIKYFICIKDWSDADYYTDSLDSPANYPNNFIQAENIEDMSDAKEVYSVHDVAPGGIVTKGTKIGLKTGYWEYYTCIQDFSSKIEGFNKFSDYPFYFIKGLTVGKALPSKGEWAFYCSGVWFGCYEIRRNYETDSIYEPDKPWEQRAMSFSRNDAASNLQVSGSEKDEVCYVRLFITKSKKMSDDTIAAGFPADSCGNKLIVKNYKHDLILECKPAGEDKVLWSCYDKVQVEWGATINVTDWSWQAFSKRYGWPLLCEIYNKRLVFASTEDQPQTIWMSRTDDLDNFDTSGSSETAAMALTLNTTSQNPICWLHSQSYRLMLGTSEAEYSISAGQSQAGISNSNAQIEDHSHVGSDGVAALALNDIAMFVERGAGRVYTLQYSFQIDGYTARDASVFAPHIGTEHGGIVEMSSIRKPDTVALFVLGDGQLGLCTHNTFHEINAWHRWVTDGRILSVCGMPDGMSNDKIFLIVKRQKKMANGTVLSESVSIEVVDEENGFKDGDRDYTSLLVVNAMIDYREGFFGKRCSEPNYLCLGEDFKMEGENILISDNGGKRWFKPQHEGDGVLRKGWNKQHTPSGYKYEIKPSIKVTGNQGIHILGLRG